MRHAPLPTLETYYDTAPRASADAEEVGPFTLFVRRDPDGRPFYARPCPLLVLAEESQDHPLSRLVGEDLIPRTAVLTPDDPDLPLAVGAVHAGFSSSDDVEPRDASRQQRLMERGLLGVVAAYDEHGGVDTVFLSAQDDAVARVYERVGFVRVGTACIAEEASE